MYENERNELAEKLKNKGISDEDVLSAFRKVQRHLFVPDVMKHHSYVDTALPIGYGQTISQPYTVAFMTQALDLFPDSKVLEIGTGSGFQAAILAEMGMKVYTIERNEKIFFKTQKLFDELKVRAMMRCGDGTIGWNEYAPFDGIIVTAGGPVVPPALKKQLAVNGRLVIPVGDRQGQTLQIYTKLSETDFKLIEVPNFAFVPLIGKDGWKEK
ncbi:MAG: protein-L-isoaspartate(D-aspartate) O-methyltransferase [Ignavibacteria bacterium]|nr:protein-L-isoaspartate(D-aspartate) O-methyltransferase [Ignavibacteria bacterium]